MCRKAGYICNIINKLHIFIIFGVILNLLQTLFCSIKIMNEQEFKDFQSRLREAVGNTYTVRVDKILNQEEADELIKYVRTVNNDPDGTIEILMPLEAITKPKFDFQILEKNHIPIENTNVEKFGPNQPTVQSVNHIDQQSQNEAKKIYGENWAVLQNRLLNAISDLERDERRLIMFLSPLIRKAVSLNPKQNTFKVIAKEFGKEYGITDKHVYDILKKISQSIHGKVFYYWNFDDNVKSRVGVSWVGRAEYKEKDGIIEIMLIDEVIYMLTVFDQSNPFTKIERKYIANLGSYGIVLYELVASCMHQDFKSKSYEMKFLREKFNTVDKYPLTAEFRRNVIDKAIKDIEAHTPFRISYELKKEGKKLKEIVFSFYDSSVKEDAIESSNQEKAIENKNLKGWQAKGLSDAQIKKVAIYQKEFIDANSSKISPNDRRDYSDIFEEWKTILKNPKQVNNFHKIQELLDRQKS